MTTVKSRLASATRKTVLLSLSVLLLACTSVPEGIQPVQDFQLKPYLGTWYEIARLDHRFEENLQKVTASYSMRDDGGVKVVNKGYNTKDEEWSEAEGKAYFVQEPNVGHLKVSFWGPFYASYVIFELDPQGQYAFITGNDRDYLWLLARSPQVDQALKDQFVTKAKSLGFDLSELVWVDHSL